MIPVSTPTGFVVLSKPFNGSPVDLSMGISGLCKNSTRFHSSAADGSAESWAAEEGLLSSFEKEYLLQLQEQSNTVMEVCFRTIPEAQKQAPVRCPRLTLSHFSSLFSLLCIVWIR